MDERTRAEHRTQARLFFIVVAAWCGLVALNATELLPKPLEGLASGAALLIALMLLGIRAGLRNRALRRRAVTCPKCGYPLRGLRGGACPECGDPVPEHRVR